MKKFIHLSPSAQPWAAAEEEWFQHARLFSSSAGKERKRWDSGKTLKTTRNTRHEDEMRRVPRVSMIWRLQSCSSDISVPFPIKVLLVPVLRSAHDARVLWPIHQLSHAGPD